MRIVALLSLFCVVAAHTAAQSQQPAAPAARGATQAPRPAAAQPAGRSGLALTVTDPRGATIPAVGVELTGPTPRSGETDTSGQINFPGLQPGTYRLRFSGETVTAFEREVALRAGQILKLNISLNAAPPPREVAAEPPPPPAAPPPPEVGPTGTPQVQPLVNVVKRETIGKSEARKDTLLACSGNTRSMLVQLNELQSRRAYEGAEALYYVISGEGTINVDGKEVILRPTSYAALPRGVAHSLTKTGKQPLTLLAVLSGEPCEEAR